MIDRKQFEEKKYRFFHSIHFKIRLSVAISGLILLVFSLWLLSDSMNYVERDLINDRLESDMNVLIHELGAEDGYWSEKDGALYLGDTLIGDGTYQNAYEEPMKKCEEMTGTFCYIFLRTYNDDELGYNENFKTYEGHYLRVAGTTLGASGRRMEGTYIDKRVADLIDSTQDDSVIHAANVGGRDIYSRYVKLFDKDGKLVGLISNGRSAEEMKDLMSKQKTRGFIIIIFVLIIMSIGLGVIVTMMLKAIRKIRARLALIGNGEFPDQPLRVNTKDELEDVARSVNTMVESLKEKERIGAELSLATDIQAHMLPSIFPPFPEHKEIDLYAIMNPAKEVGGDFYDFFMLDEDHVAAVIADVSGKGVPAALFMVIAKTLIKNHAQMGLSPAEIFSKVNQMLCEGNDVALFVTAWLGILDMRTGKLTYVNAGHNPPLVKRNGEFTFLTSRPAFVLAGMDGVRYRQYETDLLPGDRLFLYTDGVTEATDKNNELYGNDRLKNYLNAHADEDATAVIGGLRADVDAFQGADNQFDDITMLMLDFKSYKKDSGMIEREFAADDKELADVMGFVEEELEKLGCPPKTVMQITVAVEEIFVNIAHYAYIKARETMKLGIRPGEDGGVTLRFTDHGMPFDPLAQKDPDITLSAEERNIGGLGIFMVKKTMDGVDYKFENGKNVLTLQKKF